MFWCVFVSAYYALFLSGISVAGQCTIPNCAASVSGSGESLLESLKEHDQKVRSMLLNLSSRFDVQQTSNIDFIKQWKEQMQILQMMHQNLSSTLETVKRSFDEKFQLMNEQLASRLGLTNSRVVSASEAANEKANEKLNVIFDQVNENLQYIGSQDNCRNNPVVCDCYEIKKNDQTMSGVYRIYVVHQNKRFYATAYCDMTTANGGWTVFQRRKDGSVDFYRDWKDYAYGFGNPKGEFWLGNNFLHLLTSKRRYRLRIDLEDFEGENRYAEYSAFNISSSEDKYRLAVSGYSGTAGTSLIGHNGQQFSTKDNDNDAAASSNCAVSYRGAWWYYSCYHSNLNGLYLRGPYSSNDSSIDGRQGIRWIEWHDTVDTRYSLKTTEMKIIPY